MKKFLIVFLFIILLAPLSASVFDASFFWGPAVMDFTHPGVSVTYGLNFGVNKGGELSLWGASTLTPSFFKDNYLALEYTHGILGDRTTGTAVSGSGLNMLIGGGILASMNNPYNIFMPTDIFISFTPLSVGNPILGKRERFSKLMVSYNPFENKVGVFMNILLFDYYFCGTWRDYK